MGIKHCPSCGSGRIKKVHGSLTREFEGETYTVPNVTYYSCPDCGERVYEGDSVEKIQARSPAYHGELADQ
jgi:YgiT-type zinc finger domain-containing protein